MSNKLIRGTMILTIGTYLSRLLGIIYIIPFYWLVGEEGNALYQSGYSQYVIFIAIATAGFPQGVSKFVSKYNSLGDYETSRKMFKVGFITMLFTGFAAFFILFLIAPFLASAFLSDQSLGGFTVDDVTHIIRMVSFALIVVPIMGLIRGFFQGHQSMGPTAVSQVMEQLIRIIFLLVATFLTLNVFNNSLVTAVGYATFAAFIGAIGGLFVLLWYWKKRKDSLLAMQENIVPSAQFSTRTMLKEIFRYAGPFVFVGLAIPLYNYIDTNTFNRAMSLGGYGQALTLFGVLALVSKIIMIPVSLATAFGLTIVPTMTTAYTEGKMDLVKQQIDQSFQIIMFFILPAVVGIYLLAEPLYSLFFSYDPVGSSVLATYSPIALLFSFFTVSAAILQGVNKQKLAVISLALGLVVKASLNIPLIILFAEKGAIYATGIGFFVSIVYSLAMIKRHANYSFERFLKRSMFMAILTIIMSMSIIVAMIVLNLFINFEDGKIPSLIYVLITVSIGGFTYLYLSYKTPLLETIFGGRFTNIKFKVKRRRNKHEN
ncbi:polysaccharide biosynthesis protein [Bacillus carboniphilus]|uniref:Polysaccharide biosynthesis protein n=1 Tax=Bacillus carboniphilus TaxID=86663 RepID=A0ABY9JPC1_9BACI|nr:polysaccharide biosynthesis protein [Bacillus carboniphilus]WLR41157.1 polysaccharide biosynthesis protein [Bacillus carboniphilus]